MRRRAASHVTSRLAPLASAPTSPPGHPASRPTLHAITGLRAVAALLVVLYHYDDGVLSARAPWAGALIGRGYVGVSFFFVLSGFILTYVYADGDRAWNAARRRAFWVARVARIYPVYALALALTAPGFVVAVLALPPTEAAARGIASAVTTPLLVHAWTPWTSTLWNFPSWSLAVEAFAYALFPLVVPRLWGRPGAVLVGAALGLWAVGLAVPFAVEAAGGRAGVPFAAAFAMSAPLVHLPQVLVGACAGALVLRAPRASAGVRAGAWDVAAAAVAVLTVGLLASGVPLLRTPLNGGLLAPAFAALAYALARAPAGVWARTVGSAPMRWLGEASYAIYLLQLPVYQLLGPFGRLGLERGTGRHLAAYLAVLVGVSALVVRVVERPARRALRRRLSPASEP